jgi:HK97 family phage major capsid protein
MSKELEDLSRRVLERLKQGDSQARRVDATGKQVPFAKGDGTAFGDTAPAFIRSRGEQPYSLANVILSVATRDKAKAPLEWAISEKLEQTGYAPSAGGILVPLGGDELWRMPGYEQVVERVATEVKQAFAVQADPAEVMALRKQLATKAMDPYDDTLGGSLLVPMQGELINLLRPMAVVSRAGARQIPLPPAGAISFPKEGNDPTFTWLGPNTTIPDSNQGTGSLLLMPKRAAGLVKVPNDLIRYARAAAEVLVRGSLAQRAALTEDLSFLEGTGGTLQPLGITRYPRSANNTPTRDSITLHNATTTGANGDTLEPEDALKAMALVEEAPDPMGATTWMMRPLLFASLANARADAVSAGDKKGPFIFPVTRGPMGGVVEKMLAGLPVLTSTQIAGNRVKGSGTNLTYTLCGNFTQALIGRVGVIELAASGDAGFASDQTWIRAIIRVDFGLMHPESFVLTDTVIIPA